MYRKDYCIPMYKLKQGYLYKIDARNAGYGIWNYTTRGFLISRVKFKSNYIFEEYHWDSDPHFGTAQPLEEIERSPFAPEDLIEEPLERNGNRYIGYAKHTELLEYLNRFEERERYG